ncbi:Transposable element Hobo transposase [Triplophysa tibetana]|uniref:Transposable element Hobo transposase n=1 Tax=Triplophysa tibetana TaxID=1572043 RepID=A0A5A9PK93_9TELE|nr:Transposable element Hobo transposase [Triplophysa tibetana]
MDPEELKKKIARGDCKVVDNTSSKLKSSVWEKFRVISDEESNIVKGFAACKTCLKVFVFDSRRCGTSSLRKHADTCAGNKLTRSIEQYLSKGTELKVPRRDDKDTITRLSVNFVCNDIRPFDAVHGEGFFALAQGLIDVGAKAGRVDVKQLLPDPTTVSRGVNKYAEKIRQELIPELKMQLEGGNGAVTLDMWTDDYRKTSYLCVTLHYINNKWELIERVLCTSEWDSSLRKTADNIKPAIISALRKFGIDEFYSKLVYVTDRGANIVAALRTVTRLSCAAHIFNTVLYTTFKPSQEDMYGEEVTAMIDSAKSLVTYFKQTSLQARLKKTLKNSVETRWNSLHTMLESISNQFEDIRTLLEERGEVDRLTNLDEEALSDFVAYLERFKEATKALEASKTPTLHLTIVWYERIRRHLRASSNDSNIISSLKEKCLSILQDKFDIHRLHRLAMFLHPKLKSMKLIADSSEVASVHSEMRRLVKDLKDKRGSPEEHCHHPPPEKRVRVSADTLSDVEDSNDEAPQYQDEVAAYIDHKTPKDDHFEILSWWQDHAHLFPNIAQIARSILAIPASSAASERDFSCAGYVIQERSQLKPSTVDDVLFLHSNLKHHHHK